MYIRTTVTCVRCVFFMSSEGNGNVEKVQEKVARIQQLMETLREETAKNGAAKEKSDLCQQVFNSCHFKLSIIYRTHMHLIGCCVYEAL